MEPDSNNTNMQDNSSGALVNSHPVINQNGEVKEQSSSIQMAQDVTYQQPVSQPNMAINSLENNNINNQNSQLENLQTSQLINTSNSVNMPVGNGNNSFNIVTNSKNRKKLIICLIVVAVIILFGVGTGLIVNELRANNKNENTNNSAEKNDFQSNGIKQIEITHNEIIALGSDDGLYFIGDGDGPLLLSNYIYGDNEEHKTIKKVAPDIEKFYSSGLAIYYINKDQDLSYIGASYDSGSSNQAVNEYDGVKDVVVFDNFCGFIIDDNNELYIKNGMKQYCGLNNSYSTFTKMASNVKSIFVNGFYGGYINNNNELYVTLANSNFVKLYDNVKTVIPNGYRRFLFLTNDNKLYIYEDAEYNGNYVLTLLRSDVIEIGENYFKTTNGDYNVFSNNEELPLIKSESKMLYDSNQAKSDVYYGTLKETDIKEILYFNDTRYYDSVDYIDAQKKLIYLSNDNKLVLVDENNKEEIDYDINNLEKIYNFVVKKNLVKG